MKIVLLLLVTTFIASAQRITTIQLDGVQYFVSRMNPYSPELNYFLAYQYCRSLGLQLASFESKEKADTMTQYLKNAGYTKYDFWTSGNKLGTDMFLWMSTGLPFNATFDYMLRRSGNQGVDVPPGTEPQRVARESGDSGSADGCVAMTAPSLAWDAQDCTLVKDFICEQTRCYYYNYGSIPVSATQGNRRPYATMTTTTASPEYNRDDKNDVAAVAATAMTAEAATATLDKETESTHHVDENVNEEETSHHDENETPEEQEQVQTESDDNSSSTPNEESHSIPDDPVVGRLMNTLATDSSPSSSLPTVKSNDETIKVERSRTQDIPDITSLFGNAAIKTRTATVFDGLQTHDIRSLQRANQQSKNNEKMSLSKLTHEIGGGTEESKTIGPYDSIQDYVNDEPESAVASGISKDHDDDSSTPYPDAEPAYRYNIKVRSNGKVLDPPSK